MIHSLSPCSTAQPHVSPLLPTPCFRHFVLAPPHFCFSGPPPLPPQAFVAPNPPLALPWPTTALGASAPFRLPAWPASRLSASAHHHAPPSSPQRCQHAAAARVVRTGARPACLPGCNSRCLSHGGSITTRLRAPKRESWLRGCKSGGQVPRLRHAGGGPEGRGRGGGGGGGASAEGLLKGQLDVCGRRARRGQRNTRLAGWAEAEQGAQPAGVVGAVFSRAAAAAQPSGRAHAPRAAGLVCCGTAVRQGAAARLIDAGPAGVPTAADPMQTGAELRLHAVAWLRFGADAIAQQAQRSAGAPAS